MSRLFFESAVVALVVWGGYRWTHPPTPPLVPTFSSGRPSLDMPPAPALRPDRPSSAMIVVPESLGARRVDGRSVQEAPLGSTPALFSQAPSPAREARAARRASAPTWDERLRDPRMLGAVFALFLVFYALLAQSLRRGPGGGGLKHD
jgi:hypothetical protein